MENDKLKEKEALMEGKTYTTKVIRIFSKNFTIGNFFKLQPVMFGSGG